MNNQLSKACINAQSDQYVDADNRDHQTGPLFAPQRSSCLNQNFKSDGSVLVNPSNLPHTVPVRSDNCGLPVNPAVQQTQSPNWCSGRQIHSGRQYPSPYLNYEDQPTFMDKDYGSVRPDIYAARSCMISSIPTGSWWLLCEQRLWIQPCIYELKQSLSLTWCPGKVFSHCVALEIH
jgi:hypothetical protein